MAQQIHGNGVGAIAPNSELPAHEVGVKMPSVGILGEVTCGKAATLATSYLQTNDYLPVNFFLKLYFKLQH
ncbi:hypothetical protein GS597_17250 [Synechococcales cyanobacterium C]|uniref:Uncharacterized protein n=1 Tax=Petrachloros mirabilis ULC683 TaxID=2781853 RepID=A0A8K2A282_9CYAN|nr:hypothetical protein [Petrachloros mirabilis]NCJ08222.1 hypothetical protein [Petrachloros mirabilis ULC683]